MASEELFSKFLRYFFLINGIPVYYENQKKSSFLFWYIWKIFFIGRYNVDLILNLKGKWIFPYTMFALNDAIAASLITDSLIGKHKRILELQKSIVTTEVEKNYCFSPTDKRKIKTLQTFFGLVFTVSTVYLIYVLLRFSSINKEILKDVDNSQLLTEIMEYTPSYIFFTNIISWITTISNTLFYCILCIHLQVMFKSINIKVGELGRSFVKIKTNYTSTRFSQEHLDGRPGNSYEIAMTCQPSIFPESISHWPENSACLPHETKKKRANPRLIRRPTTNCKFFNCCGKDIGCSCLIIGSSKFPRYPLKVSYSAETSNLSKEDIIRNNCLARKIQNLNKEFSSASLMVQEADNLFSLQVLIILTVTFLRTCTYIYAYINNDWSKYDCCALFGILQQILFDFLAFGSVAFEASHVADEARKFSRTVKGIEEIYTSKSLRVQLQSDVAQMTAHSFNVQLTAWKFFTVSRNFVPTVIGVTTTYVLVILQLHQIVQEQQCSSLKNATRIHLQNYSLETPFENYTI